MNRYTGHTDVSFVVETTQILKMTLQTATLSLEWLSPEQVGTYYALPTVLLVSPR
jgi:hypothetical protein